MFHRVAVIGSLLVASFSTIASGQLQPEPQPNVGVADPALSPANSTSINGMVRTQTNDAVPDARVEVHDLATGTLVTSTYSGPNGSFELQRIPAGRYEIVATSGLSEAREQMSFARGHETVTLRFADASPQPTGVRGAPTVSVAEMAVPKDARKALKKAQDLSRKNKIEDARKEIDRALQIYPKFAEAFRVRGVLALQKGELEPARADFEKAIENDPNSPLSYVAFAAACNSLNRYDDAERALAKGAVLAPAMWQVYFESARAQLGKGDFSAALRSATKTEQFLRDDYAPLHLVKAHALLGLKNYPEAMTELEKYLSKEPDGPNSAKVKDTLNEVKAFTARSAK